MPGPASHLRVLTPVLLACMSRLSSSLGGVHDVPPEQLFSAAECADLLERISGAQLEQGMLKGPAGGEVHDSIIRDSSIAWLPIRDGSGLEWVRERLLQAAALQAPGMVATSDPAHLDLYPKWKLQVAVYSAGSHYRWHTDSDSKRADLSTVSRMLSATVQLTDSSTLPPPSSSSPRPPLQACLPVQPEGSRLAQQTQSYTIMRPRPLRHVHGRRCRAWHQRQHLKVLLHFGAEPSNLKAHYLSE